MDLIPSEQDDVKDIRYTFANISQKSSSNQVTENKKTKFLLEKEDFEFLET